MTDDLEARLRAAVHAEADTADLAPANPAAEPAANAPAAGAVLSEDDATPLPRREDDSLVAIRSRVRTIRRRRRALAAAAATAVVVVAVAALPRLGNDRADVDTVGRPDHDLTTTPPDQPSTTTVPGTTAPTSTEAVTPPAGSGTATTSTADPADPAEPDILGDGYQPLWPFATRAAAASWQDAYRTGGQQPWHLSAEDTALSFTTGFLGFTEIDRVVESEVSATEAEVSVGYANPDGGGTSTAAVIHLMRYGSGDDAPWEVVGTRDTDLLLETPDYGTTAGSPMRVAGYITGVDESLQVQVRQSSTAQPLGRSAGGVPAGGTDAPWETTVTFSGATDPAITVVVSTGGHVQDVERFAITGLRS